MSWEEQLLELYEKNSFRAGETEYRIYYKNGKEKKIPYVLCPLYHTTVAAQIQIVLSTEGQFLGASKVSEEDKMTIIPVTEKSLGGRTSGAAPHPLCDNLQYLAGDYKRYVQQEKSYFELYLAELEKWHFSKYTHEKVDAVYTYLRKKELMKDLIREKVLKLDETGYLSENIKIGSVYQKKSFVRFIVRSGSVIPIENEREECWKDRILQERFIEYYMASGGEKEIDYLTGSIQPASYLYPKNIRNEGDGAKLISSNDKNNFTFRGRFSTKEQAFAIGSESSQKIHNALKWIIRRQGKSFDTLTMVTWESDLQDMPFWDADTDTISSMGDVKEAVQEESGDDFQEFADEAWEEEEEEVVSDGNPVTARQFYSVLEGYGEKIGNTSKMVLMAFDAATTGRLCLAEYKTLETSRYLQNIKDWHEHCGWLQYKYKDGKRKEYYGVPGVKDMADILYGTEVKGRLAISDKNGKKLYGELSRRLLACIWDRRNLPYDLVMIAVNKASMPQSYKERYNWERVLTLACSFVKKSLYEKNQKEEWNVALNEECKERDYLYGRLLAVADRIEYRTYDKEKDSGRVTNAKRYMSAFSQRPYDTWKIVEENLQPYLGKLFVKERKYYENLIDSICQLFTVESYQDNRKLDGLYLLGFHSQSYDLKKYKEEKKETEQEEENE
mgnify:CR=1 FL=1